jgi:hypothetical protein
MPADLIEWRLHLDTNIKPIKSTNHKQPTGVKLHSKDSLNPLAPIFQPKCSRPIGEHTPPQSCLYPSKIHTKVGTQEKCDTCNTTASLPVKEGPVKKGPSKRTSFLLPGQSLLTKYLPLKNPKPASPLSLSEPTPVSEHTSQSTILSSELKPKDERPKPEKPTVSDELPKPKCTQKTLYDFSYFKPYATISADDPDVFGHVPQEIEISKAFRIVLQNPNGIKASVTEPDFMFSLHLSHEIGIGALCLAETNLNWHHYQHTAALRRCLHRNWSASKFQTSVPEEQFIGNYQPGGTATIVTDRWTSRVVKTGADPFGLGRWSYIVLKGKSDINICVITAYRVCNNKYTGPKTAYQQQRRHLAALFRQTAKVLVPDPFKQFVLDLQSWITCIQQDGTHIILCLDNNEELLPNEGQLVSLPVSTTPAVHKTHDGRMETLVRSVGLADALRHQHPSATYPATYNRGKKRIDLILVSVSVLPAVKRSGILPYNSIFQGDHWPCYIDLDAAEAFGGQTASILPPC